MSTIDSIANYSYLYLMTMISLKLPESLDEVLAMSPDVWKAMTGAEPHIAVVWIRQSAGLGHPDAQVIYGQWLLEGRGITADPVKALSWFLKAGRQGHVMGMNMAGRCFDNGWGTEPDHFAAANWFRQAAHKGLDAGMYNYANLLASGQGVRKDETAALEWYRRAARQGHAKSMTKIAYFYEDGRVVRRDADAAFEWFEKGARGGDFRGQFNYASILAARGRNDEALFWLQKVPQTATKAYRLLVGEKLLDSSHASFQSVGRAMLADAGRV
ncbi:MAG: sel1 repeat family protein [Curvibacter sp.]|nr:MAG: sel1 repeat family protein [Curvibacter sp.]